MLRERRDDIHQLKDTRTSVTDSLTRDQLARARTRPSLTYEERMWVALGAFIGTLIGLFSGLMCAALMVALPVEGLKSIILDPFESWSDLVGAALISIFLILMSPFALAPIVDGLSMLLSSADERKSIRSSIVLAILKQAKANSVIVAFGPYAAAASLFMYLLKNGFFYFFPSLEVSSSEHGFGGRWTTKAELT